MAKFIAITGILLRKTSTGEQLREITGNNVEDDQFLFPGRLNVEQIASWYDVKEEKRTLVGLKSGYDIIINDPFEVFDAKMLKAGIEII